MWRHSRSGKHQLRDVSKHLTNAHQKVKRQRLAAQNGFDTSTGRRPTLSRSLPVLCRLPCVLQTMFFSVRAATGGISSILLGRCLQVCNQTSPHMQQLWPKPVHNIVGNSCCGGACLRYPRYCIVMSMPRKVPFGCCETVARCLDVCSCLQTAQRRLCLSADILAIIQQI